jgi:hypothetical protein
MFSKLLIINTLKVKSIIFNFLLISVFILSCSKKIEDVIPEKKCLITKINLPTWGRVIELGYDNQKRITSYKNTYAFTYATFEYNAKGDMIKFLQYSDDFANQQANSIVEVNCRYDDKSILQEISIDDKKGIFSGLGLANIIPVSMNDKKQVTSLKFSNYSVIFEYDSNGNVIKTYQSNNPKDYKEYTYDNKKNAYQDFPWMFKYWFTNNGFGANNVLATKEIYNSITTNYSVKYQYNADGFPINATQSSDGKVFNEFEYKCD